MFSSRPVIVVLIGLILTLGIVWKIADAHVEMGRSVQKWEYKQAYIVTGDEGEMQLNKLGEDGWELVAIYVYEQQNGAKVHRSILKRPK